MIFKHCGKLASLAFFGVTFQALWNLRKLIHIVSILDVHYIWIKTKNDDKKGLVDCVNFKAECVTVASKLGSWIGTKKAKQCYQISFLIYRAFSNDD